MCIRDRILGPIQIGDHVRVAANAVVLQDVPANSTVVGVPGRVVRVNGEKLDHVHTPDPICLLYTSRWTQSSSLKSSAETLTGFSAALAGVFALPFWS